MSPSPAVHPRPRGERVRLALIGVSGRGAENLVEVRHEEIVALCDVDTAALAGAVARLGEGAEPFRGRTYADYRVLLDAERDLDAVVVSTPDHTHACIAAAALRRGLDVYCEKPLAHSVEEVRAIQRLARARGAVTQMGTQIHAGENYRRVVELVRAGALGDVREVHVWVNKSWSEGRLGWPQPVPATLDWDLWQGPVRERPFRAGLHPASWRRFWDYGTGTLGDMACHYVDLVHWALGLATPARVRADGPPPDPVGTPSRLHVEWEHPARGARPPVRVHWYDGGLVPEGVPAARVLADGSTETWDSGQLFVGTRGRLVSDYGRHRLLDGAALAQPPPPSLASSIGHHREWLAGIRERRAASCDFAYAGDLTTTVLLGNVAYRAGMPVTWDENRGTVAEAGARAYLSAPRRAGFEL